MNLIVVRLRTIAYDRDLASFSLLHKAYVHFVLFNISGGVAY